MTVRMFADNLMNMVQGGVVFGAVLFVVATVSYLCEPPRKNE